MLMSVTTYRHGVNTHSKKMLGQLHVDPVDQTHIWYGVNATNTMIRLIYGMVLTLPTPWQVLFISKYFLYI